MAECCQKYPLCQKFLQVKIVKDSILYKKVSGQIRLSPPRGEPERSKNYTTEPKIGIISKDASNKSC